jgi:hypothetical protein
MLVKATREGLPGQLTSSGYRIDSYVPFVALPSTKALRKVVQVTNPKTSKTAIAIVLDVGPWNIHDDDYVFGTARPQAESGIDDYGRKTNGAGIDLGEWVWKILEMVDNGEVDWKFIE